MANKIYQNVLLTIIAIALVFIALREAEIVRPKKPKLVYVVGGSVDADVNNTVNVNIESCDQYAWQYVEPMSVEIERD